MNERRNFAPLVLGLLMVGIGSLFLAVNFVDFNLDWLYWFQFLFPILFMAWGASKLVRHFGWSQDELARHPLRGGLLSGIFWISVGVVWLLDLLDRIDAFAFFGLYWPLILVLFGLGKIVDYYRFHGRLNVRAGEIVGLVFIIFLGISSRQLAAASFDLFHFPFTLSDDAPFRELAGKKFSWSSEESFPAAGLQACEIVNLYGDVTVRAGSSDQIVVKLTKDVYKPSEEEARAIAEHVAVTSSRDGSSLRIGTNRSDGNEEKNRFNTHLSLTLPPHLSVKISNRYGKVRVSDLKSPVEVDNAYGEVTVEDISATVRIKNQYRPATARQIGGNLVIQNQRGPIRAEDVTGQVELSTEYEDISLRGIQGDALIKNRFGGVHLQDVGGRVEIDGPGSEVDASGIGRMAKIVNSHKNVTLRDLGQGVDLDTSYSSVDISNVRGQLNVRAAHSTILGAELQSGVTIKARGSRITLEAIQGPFDIATSLRNVSVNGFNGQGEVLNEYGEVLLQTEQPLGGALKVVNKNGAITLSLPAKAAFKISAQAPGGKVVSNFPGSAASEETSFLEAEVGKGGPEIRLQTTHAQVMLKQN